MIDIADDRQLRPAAQDPGIRESVGEPAVVDVTMADDDKADVARSTSELVQAGHELLPDPVETDAAVEEAGAIAAHQQVRVGRPYGKRREER